jgi:hypothetical protein
LHRPPFPLTNFHVEIFAQTRSNNHRGMGILNLPTMAIGEKFPRLYCSSGLYLKGRTIQTIEQRRSRNASLLHLGRVIGVVERERAKGASI